MTYENKVVVVTGGASGLGMKMGETMGREGAKVVLADINLENLKKTKGSLKEKGIEVEAFAVDVSNLESMKTLVHRVMERYQRIDVMINNAGVGMMGSFCDVPLSDWDRMIDINIKSVIYGCRLVYPIMIKQGQGQIINTASMAGLIPMPGSAPYGMTKHAVVGLSLSLRAEAAAYGIHVSALCPAFVKTAILTDSKTYNIKSSSIQKIVNSSGGSISLDDFILEAMSGFRKNQALIVLPKSARKTYRIYRYLPKVFFKASYKIGQKVRKMRISDKINLLIDSHP